MREMRRVCLTLTVAAFLAAPVLAQPGRGGFTPTALLLNKSVQEELKLDDDQKKKVEEVNKKVTEILTEKTKDLSREDRRNREKMAPIMREVSTEADKLLGDALKPAQVKRFKQIRLQAQGLRAFSSEQVQKGLKLTDDQQKKIKEINEELSKERPTDFRAADFREKMTKYREKETEALGKIATTLSAEQKKSWKEMTGEKFEIKIERRPGGGRPGGQPRRPRTGQE
jgi:hypothetical protein